MRNQALSAAFLLSLAACGGDGGAPAPQTSDSAPAEAPVAAPASSDWFQVDEAARTVTIDLVAGQTSANNYWNFNGYYGGTGNITVPEGFTVTLNFTNRDPGMVHSVGVGERLASWPTSFSSPTPVFAGAMSSNPTSMTNATAPNQSETFVFVAETAGDYALICYIVGHAATGMWMPFTVSADGSFGIQ